MMRNFPPADFVQYDAAKRLLYLSSRQVIVARMEDGSIIRSFGNVGNHAIALSLSGRYLAACSATGTIKAYDTENQMEKCFSVNLNLQVSADAQFIHHDKALLVCAYDGQVILLSFPEGKKRLLFQCPEHFWIAAFCQTDRYIVFLQHGNCAKTEAGSLIVYDAQTLQPISQKTLAGMADIDTLSICHHTLLLLDHQRNIFQYRLTEQTNGLCFEAAQTTAAGRLAFSESYMSATEEWLATQDSRMDADGHVIHTEKLYRLSPFKLAASITGRNLRRSILTEDGLWIIAAHPYSYVLPVGDGL